MGHSQWIGSPLVAQAASCPVGRCADVHSARLQHMHVLVKHRGASPLLIHPYRHGWLRCTVQPVSSPFLGTVAPCTDLLSRLIAVQAVRPHTASKHAAQQRQASSAFRGHLLDKARCGVGCNLWCCSTAVGGLLHVRMAGVQCGMRPPVLP
jgi:hypothetical protein